MTATIRIKRRVAGGAAGAPISLAAGELAYNEQDGVLYIGKTAGTVGPVFTGGGGSAFTASSTAPSSPSPGDHWYDLSTGALSIYINDGNSSQWVQISPSGLASPVLRGYIDGLILSYVNTLTFMVASGQASDSANSVLMSLVSPISKTTSAWAVGNNAGGLDTGSIAASTWYHVYLIRRSDTGVVDALFSTSALSPTMPANYNQRRRIGSIKTNASSQFISFLQYGDRFYWVVVVEDLVGVAPQPTSYTLPSVPLGVRVFALLSIWAINQAGNTQEARVYPVDISDTMSSVSSYWHMGTTVVGMTDTRSSGNMMGVLTDTAQRIRILVIDPANTRIHATVNGWDDSRGKNL